VRGRVVFGIADVRAASAPSEALDVGRSALGVERIDLDKPLEEIPVCIENVNAKESAVPVVNQIRPYW
jgi:hypothetical protein